jgi:dipeptidyl aminopeptidase/acylaminoacyl peptidase
LLGSTDLSSGLDGECGKRSYSSRVQAVVGLAGPTDPIDSSRGNAVAITDLLGGTYEKVPEQYERASPITCVNGDDPPVLIVHGSGDTIVPLRQAELFNEKMNEAATSSRTLPPRLFPR